MPTAVDPSARARDRREPVVPEPQRHVERRGCVMFGRRRRDPVLDRLGECRGECDTWASPWAIEGMCGGLQHVEEHTEVIGLLVAVGHWSIWRGLVVFGEPVVDRFDEGVGGGEARVTVPVPVERVGELVESAEQFVGVARSHRPPP